MNFEEARAYIIDKLQNELRPELYYHSLQHTIDVLESANGLAKTEGVTAEELILIRTAALYHDAGMITTYEGHEAASVELAERVLPDFGYTAKQIKQIAGMIMATKLPQTPHNILECILCDADLDYLGSDRFYMVSHRLKQEWHVRGNVFSLKQWYQGQVAFLNSHTFFTASAKALRDEKKLQNLKEIEELFASTLK